MGAILVFPEGWGEYATASSIRVSPAISPRRAIELREAVVQQQRTRASIQDTNHVMVNDHSTNPTTESTSSTGFAATLSSFAPTMKPIFRIGASLLFMQHGAQKLFGLLGGDQVESFFSLMGLAGVLEFFGGLLVALGLITRPVALILTVEMLVAYFMAHQPQGGFPIQNDGELALLFALTFALLAVIGPGKFSLDNRNRADRV